MTNDNDLIRRGDAMDVTDDYEFKAFIRALPAVAASQDADADLLFDAYKGLLVLHRILDKHGLIVGAETTNKLADRIVAAHPEFPPRTALRSAVAASPPADPVINAGSRQRVVVKPLVWWQCTSTLPRKVWKADTILGQFVAWPNGSWKRHGYYGYQMDCGTLDSAKAAAQADYETRILAALDVQPDPRDEVIARLVEAATALEMWDAARGYPVPYRVRDPLRAALAAVKGGDA